MQQGDQSEMKKVLFPETEAAINDAVARCFQHFPAVQHTMIVQHQDVAVMPAMLMQYGVMRVDDAANVLILDQAAAAQCMRFVGLDEIGTDA